MENQFTVIEESIGPLKTSSDSSVTSGTTGENNHESLLDILGSVKLPEKETDALPALTLELTKRGIQVEPISTKRGYKIVLVEADGKRYAVWLRAKPVSRKALETAKKMLKNYEIDGKILVKLVRKADYARVSGWVKL